MESYKGESEDSKSGRSLRSRKSGRTNGSNHTQTRCRFLPEEVEEMERLLIVNKGRTPSRSVQEALAHKFSNGVGRNGGHAPVRAKQVWNWFQNKRYKLSKLDKADNNGQSLVYLSAEKLLAERGNGLQFEVKSARDGAWYDVKSFLGHKFTEAGDTEILVRFSTQGKDDDEWVELKRVRQRSLPCESFECLAIYPGDNILCYQEGDEHALYYDATVIDVQRRRHDIRGCRCRFYILYDHDQFEEVVTLKKLCRRPETDARLKQFNNTLNKTLMKLNSGKPREGFTIDLNTCPNLEQSMSTSSEFDTTKFHTKFDTKLETMTSFIEAI